MPLSLIQLRLVLVILTTCFLIPLRPFRPNIRTRPFSPGDPDTNVSILISLYLVPDTTKQHHRVSSHIITLVAFPRTGLASKHTEPTPRDQQPAHTRYHVTNKHN